MLDLSAFGDPKLARRLSDRRWAVLVTVFYFVVVALGMAHHEPWRDELQAWMIARDSGSIAELFRNMRYEGHPAGWHLLLFVLSRATRNPAAMQALHVLIATASSYLVLRFAPMPRLHRGLLVFGYFFAFEYAVISRSYALGVLALFAFCALFPVRHRHPIAMFAALVVLASSSIYGVILSLAAALVVAGDAIAATTPPAESAARRRATLMGGAIWLASIGVAIGQAVPPPEATFVGYPARPAELFAKWEMATTLARVWDTFVPVPDPRDPHLWGTHLLSNHATRASLALMLTLSALLMLAAALMFLRRPLVLFLYLSGTGGLLLFTYFIHAGYLRHDGHLFVLFVACLWLAGYPTSGWRLPGWLNDRVGARTPAARAFVTTVLVVQCAAAAVIYSQDLRRPFSNGRDAAAYLRRHGLDTLPLAGSHGPEVSTVSALLDRPIHHLAAGRTWTFVPWREAGRHLALPPGRLANALSAFLDGAGDEAVLLLGYPFDAWGAEVIGVPLAAFTGGIERTEQFYLYRVTRIGDRPIDENLRKVERKGDNAPPSRW